jgi:hypothetical protein
MCEFLNDLIRAASMLSSISWCKITEIGLVESEEDIEEEDAAMKEETEVKDTLLSSEEGQEGSSHQILGTASGRDQGCIGVGHLT